VAAVTRVSGYTTRSGKRVGAYTRGSGALRRSQPRFRPRVAAGAMLNAVVPGRAARTHRARRLRALNYDLRQVQGGKRRHRYSARDYERTLKLERHLIREIHMTRHGKPYRNSIEVRRSLRRSAKLAA
jgi:hypothetical protein